MPKNNIAQKLVLLSASVAVSILMGEVFLRLYMPLEAKRVRYVRMRNVFQTDRKNVLFDNETGYMAKPLLNAPFENEEFKTVVTTNSAGFRDDELSIKDPRIFLLGDSVGFGWGVPDGQTCDKFLEEMTGLKSLNMGVPGYGTLQEFLLLKRWARTHDIDGKTAVFLIYPNDCIENLGDGLGVHPAASLEEGGVRISKPDPEGLRDLFEMYDTDSYRRPIYKASYIAYLLKGFIKETKNRIKSKLSGRASGEAPLPKAEVGDRRYEVFAAIIDEISVFAKEKKIKTLFVWIPSIKHFEDNSALYGQDSEEGVYKQVREVVDRSSCRFIDASPALTRNDYYVYDGHLKPSGNRKLAEVISKAL